jgi:hypothetical protein
VQDQDNLIAAVTIPVIWTHDETSKIEILGFLWPQFRDPYRRDLLALELLSKRNCFAAIFLHSDQSDRFSISKDLSRQAMAVDLSCQNL